ncbi:MAG: NDP-sugar synthase [Candidatus Goldbacteria bacterium]|nr:NDP-sugar synthase [Candidatus Goldiibacteriota bacterium]
MKALILIGGEGTRLRPLTLNTLKCMVPIVDKHFFEHQFGLLKKHGIKEIILSICHMPQKIKKILGTGVKYGVKIRYAVEESPLGTGGAIKNAEKYMDDTTIILNGDILTDIDITKMAAFHKKSNASVTIALHKVEDPSAYGLVETGSGNKVLRFLEKPNADESRGNSWINAGIYIFNKKVLDYIPAGKNYSVERQFYPQVLKAGENVCAYKADFYWLDIGRLDKYVQANFDVLEKKFTDPVIKYAKTLKWEVFFGQGVKADKKAFLRGPAYIGDNAVIKKCSINPLSIIGNNCVLGDNSSVEKSIIWEDTVIEENVVIKNSVIGRGCMIHSNAHIEDAVIGDKTIITHHSRMGRKNG